MKSIYINLKDITKRLLFILTKEQKRYALLVFGASFLGALLETVGVSAIIPLINALMTPEKLLENRILGAFFRTFHVTEATDVVIWVCVGTILLYLVKNAYFIFLSWVRVKYSGKVRRELSVKVMGSYMDKGYSYFLSKNTSELLRGVATDTTGVYSLLNHLMKFLVEAMTFVLICGFIFVTDWTMAVCIVALALFCLVFVFLFFRKKMGNQGVQSRTYGAIVNQLAIQIFQGIKEVIVMRKQKFFVKRFEENSQKQQQAFVGQLVGAESPMYIIEGFCISGLLGMIAIRMVTGGNDMNEMIPTLSAFAVGAFRILPALGKISNNFNNIIFYRPSLNNLYEQIRQVTSYKNGMVLCEQDTGIRGFEKEFCLQHVTWSYAEEQKPVLQDVDLVIHKGDSIALIGQSGAGKTTLADIMLGLLRPQYGSVTLDGNDIFSIGREWNHLMGYVPQSVYITDDTIRNNIAFGVATKEIDDEKIWRALEQAQLAEFVRSLPQGLNTMVGERGVRFSGGQRQRIAIARALYEEPQILILDEATAALDNETESAVMEAIEQLQGRITLIIVAHRLSTIRKCDKVYEVRDGGITERNKAEIMKES